LVLTSWRHGREYGGTVVPLIVMSILANRQRLGWGSWLEVIDSIPKFAATADIPTGTPQIWEPTFVRLLHEVEGVFDGSADHSNGALYWCDLRRVETPFFKDRILADPKGHPRAMDQNSFCCFK
jgi:hypothetical protein